MGLFGRRPTAPRGNPNVVPQAVLAAAGRNAIAVAETLTAAGFRVQNQEGDQLRRLIQPWQGRAFSYYDQLGEIKYASQFYARMLSPLRLYAARRNPTSGEWEEIEDKASPAVQALERIQDPGGGRESLLGSYGRLMFLAGECYLFCSRDPDTELEQWEMLSTDELRIQSGTYMRYKAPSLIAEEYREPSEDDWEPVDDDHAVAYRLWKRHPRYSMLADSTMQGVLDLCEELLLLTRAVRARARSRLAGPGILAVSEDFSYSPLEATGDEDPEVDPFLSDLTAAMTLPIQNEGAASAVVPLVIRGTTAAIKDGLRHIQIIDPTQLYPETGLRYEIIKRIALGLDMPPEILLGLEESNHWTAWQIDEQTWKGHGMPIANQFVNDLNSSFFRPQLRADDVADWQDFAIAYDATAIINHPNRSADAKDAIAARAIGKKALRTALGFGDEDAPTKDELAEMIGVAVRDGSLAWFGTPAPRGGAVETAPGEITNPNDPNSGTTPDGEPTGADVEAGPPDEPTEPPSTVVGSAIRQQLAAARIVGASDAAVLRAREAVGNRIRSRAKRDRELGDLIRDTPAREVAALLGPERVRDLGLTEQQLVVDARGLALDAFRIWQVKKEHAEAIAEQLERYVLRTIYEANPPCLPPQFESFVAGVIADLPAAA